MEKFAMAFFIFTAYQWYGMEIVIVPFYWHLISQYNTLCNKTHSTHGKNKCLAIPSCTCLISVTFSYLPWALLCPNHTVPSRLFPGYYCELMVEYKLYWICLTVPFFSVYRFIYETEKFNGVGELLEILGRLVIYCAIVFWYQLKIMSF